MNNLTIDARSTLQLFEKLETAYPYKAKIHVYLNNARYHYSQLVKDRLKIGGTRIVRHFPPAYCPLSCPLPLR